MSNSNTNSSSRGRKRLCRGGKRPHSEISASPNETSPAQFSSIATPTGRGQGVQPQISGPQATVHTSPVDQLDVLASASMRKAGNQPVEELDDLKKQNEGLLITLNGYKKKLKDFELEDATSRCTIQLLREKLNIVEVELAQSKQEKEGLAQLVEELQLKLQTTSGARRSSTFFTKISKTIDKKYITLATAVERHLSYWCAAETMELEIGFESVRKRKWLGRVRLVQSFGLNLIPEPISEGNEQKLFIPLPFTAVLNSKELFFIQSFDSHESILEKQTVSVLEGPQWSVFSTDQTVYQDSIRAISNNPTMIGKVKQFLSDSVTNRKRTVRDELFSVLKYFTLPTSHDRRKFKPMFTKGEEIEFAKDKLISTNGSGDVNFSHWRTTSVNSLTSDGTFPEILNDKNFPVDLVEDLNGQFDEDSDGDTDVNEHNPCYTSILGIHRNEISFHLWTQFLGYNPIEDKDHPVETTFVSITRLDAWIATIVELLIDNGRRGGGRQRDFGRLFHDNFNKATFQFVDKVFKFVEYWASAEVTLEDSEDDSIAQKFKTMERKATVLLHCPVEQIYYIAVNSEWFREYISPNFGVVHDCYIAKLNTEENRIIPLANQSVILEDTGRTGDQSQDNSIADDLQNTDYTKYEEEEDDLDDHLAPEIVPPLPGTD